VLYKETVGTDIGELALLTYMSVIEGPGLDHLRKYARNKLIMQGVMDAETDEEEKMLADAQQQQGEQQPDAAMMLAMAEQAKAEADMAKVQIDAQDDQARGQIDAYKAETQRLEAVAKARKAGVETDKIGMEIRGTELDNLQKLQQAFMPRGMREG
jgi:hypothetical protein